MKIISWNVNGIRSVFSKSFLNWLNEENPDIVCLQEVKANHQELSEEYTQIDGYYAYFNTSKLKKGHSGVAIYTKIKPIAIEIVLDIDRFDDEGRCIKLTFKDFVLFNFYIPHGGREKHDMSYKLEVYRKLFSILKQCSCDNTILAGDFNIAHTELDVYHAKHNYNNTMFTAEERKQLDTLISIGYIDTFRNKYPEKKSYTWWPYAGDLRDKDIGWRIDYFFVTKSLLPLVEDVFTKKEVLGSDHGLLGIILDKEIENKEGPVYKKPEVQATLF